MKKENLYIVIPAYNEEENIEAVVEQWCPIVDKIGNDSKLVIVDDGSKDKTYEKLLDCAKKHSNLIPLTKKNSGHGSTLLYAYHYALTNNPTYIFQTDSDGQTNPDEFELFWTQRNEFDVIIGHRKGRQDGFSRKVVTKTLKLVIKLKFRVWVRDANTPFRLMKSEVLQKYIDEVPENYNLSNVALTVIFTRLGVPLKYNIITFKPRQGGVNSINLKKIFKIGKKALSDFGKINKMVSNLEKKEADELGISVRQLRKNNKKKNKNV